MTPEPEFIDHCPACGYGQIDRDIEPFDGVCEGCGCIIKPDIGEIEYDSQVTIEDPESAHEEWLSYCTVRDATEERLAMAFDVLEDISKHLSVTIELRLQTAELYCESFLARVTDGRNKEAVVIACLSLVSIDAGTPIPPERLIETAEVDRKNFRRARAAIQNELEVKIRPPQAVDYVSFLSDEIDINDRATGEIYTFLQEYANRPRFVGKSAVGVAAGAIYLCAAPVVTQKEVSEAAGVSTETIRQRTSQMQELLNDD